MATLLDLVVADTVGTGTEMTGSCTVYFNGLSSGTKVYLEVSHNDSSNYVPANFDGTGPFVVEHDCAKNIDARGSYYLRARAVGVLAASPVSVEAIE
jgi:hypothetical protein